MQIVTKQRVKPAFTSFCRTDLFFIRLEVAGTVFIVFTRSVSLRLPNAARKSRSNHE